MPRYRRTETIVLPTIRPSLRNHSSHQKGQDRTTPMTEEGGNTAPRSGKRLGGMVEHGLRSVYVARLA
jgi:hypothetical protein